LKRDEMSWPARMMAIADIFEALTAADRPYKKAKTLSESLKILWFMKKDGHVDPELFELFLTSGAYMEYAEQFLKPEQSQGCRIRIASKVLHKHALEFGIRLTHGSEEGAAGTQLEVIGRAEDVARLRLRLQTREQGDHVG